MNDTKITRAGMNPPRHIAVCMIELREIQVEGERRYNAVVRVNGDRFQTGGSTPGDALRAVAAELHRRGL